ncbi:MAG: lysozyme [Azospirillum sp.]|nr:lysozyme [Azospirillum sp.]
MQIGKAGLKLLKEFEGCKLTAYRDVAGVWTIGYGHTRTAREGMRITQAEADRLLRADLDTFEAVVWDACIEVPNRNQFDAMVSLAFNVGAAGFRKSTVLRLHNRGNFVGAAKAFAMWNKARNAETGKLEPFAGLTRRRAAEAALYLTPVDDRPQTTSSATVEGPDARAVSPVTVMASAGAGLTVAQQAIAQAADVWDGLSRFGLSPNVVLAVLGAAAIAGLAWFVWNERKRQQEGGL